MGAIDLLSGAGGAKRVFCEMANTLVARGHEVYAVCHTFQTGLPFYPLDDRVHFINLDGSGRRKIKPLTWFKTIRPFLPSICKSILERYVEEPLNERKSEPLVKLIRDIQPDVVIPYFVADYLSMLRQPALDIPVILMHHNSAAEFTKVVHSPRKIKQINTCPHLQVLHRSYASEIQPIYHGTIHVIPNGVPQIEEMNLADLTLDKPQKTIVMISRLEPGKQQHLLIQAFERLAKSYSDWKVEIYGPASKEKYLRQLESMIISLGLLGRVELMGTTDHPLEVLRQADIFAFPSQYPEGFPLALTEAMAVGLPCVGLKTTPSVNELIVDGANGFLADNTPEDFAQKIQNLMDTQDLRVRMGKVGHKMMREFAPEKIWNSWETLVYHVIQEKKVGSH